MAIALGAALATAASAQSPADLVLENGVVLTLDPAQPRAEAVAVNGGRILSVGSRSQIQALIGSNTRRIDLAGKLVLPGLTDAHVHVEGLGQSLEILDLVGAESLEQTLARVEARAAKAPTGEWVLGRGWDQNDWPGKSFPTAADLDRVSHGHPVLLERVDGHAVWVNRTALQLAGVTLETPDPAGGRVMRDASGSPSGVLVDGASGLLERVLPAPSREARKRRLLAGLREAARAGLTEVHDAGVDLETVALYKELLSEAPLPARVYVMLSGPKEFLARGSSLLPEIGLGDGQLTVRSIKVVADGALGSRGALLLEPYSDEPGAKGLLTVDLAALDQLLEAALARGFQVNTHAIGDGANRLVLDAYQKAFHGQSGSAHRFRIEHAQVVSAPDLPRFEALGVIPSMQPTHCTSDMPWAGARLGAEREKGAYLWKTFVAAGVPLPFGSDAPVESIDVLRGLYAAVTRQDAKGWPASGWHPEQKLSFAEAVAGFSRDAAFAAFEENDRGRILAGHRADFTVLDRDVSSQPPGALLDARIALTMVGGRITHDPTSPSATR